MAAPNVSSPKGAPLSRFVSFREEPNTKLFNRFGLMLYVSLSDHERTR